MTVTRPAHPLGTAATGATRRRVRAAALLLALVAGVTACRPEVADAVRSSVARAPGPSSLTVQDGYLPDGASVSPLDDVPAVTRLDRELLAAVRAASVDAAADGVEVRITSGWRSAAYQRELFATAVAERGTEAARSLVLSPERSAHVAGRAVDVGPTDAADWMGRHGADHGLCQVYANEMWHFELTAAPGGPCPAQRPDATAG